MDVSPYFNQSFSMGSRTFYDLDKTVSPGPSIYEIPSKVKFKVATVHLDS